MNEKGTEKAARVADMMQTIARLIVLVIIIPSAIWLAVYFLLEGVIPDNVHRGLFSLTFGLGLAGLLVARMKYPIRGSILTTLAASAGAISLILVFNQLYATAAILHVFLISLALVARYLRSKLEISYFRYLKIRGILGFFIIISAPVPFIIFLIPTGIPLTSLVGLSLIIGWGYTFGSQYLLKDARIGILNSLLPAFGMTLFAIEGHLVLGTSIFISISYFLILFGLSFLAASQVFRFVQQSITQKPVKKLAEELRREELLRSVGIEIESDKQVTQQTTTEDTIWVIKPNHAQITSGFALLILAAGIPVYFIWMVRNTTWVDVLGFTYLFFPLAILTTVLVSTPSIVLFRLGGVLKRSQESKIVRLLGFSVVLDACVGLFFWSNFYGLYSYSIPMSILLFITGITGVFKEIRLLWKAAYVRILSALHASWIWMKRHYIHIGITLDVFVTSLVAYMFLWPYALSIGYQPFIFIFSSSTLIFTVLGLLGLSTLKIHRHKNILQSIAISTFLIAVAALTFWQFSQSMGLISAASLSSIWFLFFAVLQRYDITRRIIAIPFLLGLAGVGYNSFLFETQIQIISIPILSLSLMFILAGAMLHREYLIALLAIHRLFNRFYQRVIEIISKAFHKISSALRRIGGAIKRVLIRIGTTIRLGLIRIGGMLYRAGVWIGTQIVRFVLVLYALVLVYFIGNYGFGLFLLQYQGGLLPLVNIISNLLLIFLVLYTPAIYIKGMKNTKPFYGCVVLFAIGVGVFLFSLTYSINLILSLTFSSMVSLALLSLVGSRINSKLVAGLPYATWFAFSLWLSFYTFAAWISFNGIFAGLLALFVSGLCSLPIRINQKLRTVSTILYLILCVPSGTFITFLFVFNDFLLTSLVLIILPAFVLHQQYATGLKMIGAAMIAAGTFVAAGIRLIGTKIANGLRIIGRIIKAGFYRIGSAIAMIGRIILMVIAAHFIIFMGVVSIGIGLFIIQYLLPIIQSYIYWEIHLILDFILLVSIFWTPSLVARRADYSKIISVVVIMMAGAIGGITFLTFMSVQILNAALLSISFTLMIIAAGVPNLKTRKVPLVVALGSLLALMLNILSFEPILSSGLVVLSIGFLSIPFLSSLNRWRIAYPLSVGTVFALIFYYGVYAIFGILVAITGYVMVFSLFLMIPEEIRSWQAWWLFCFSIGYFLFTILTPLPYFQFIAPIFVVVELLRLTPDIEYRFLEYSEQLSVLRAILLSVGLYVLLPPSLEILFSLQITAIVFLLIITFSIWNEASSRLKLGIVNLLSSCVSLLAATYFILIRGVSFSWAIYLSIIPILVSLIYSSYETEKQHFYWLLLRGLLVALTSIVWFTIYQIPEALALSVPTGLFVGFLLSNWTPWAGIPQQGISRYLCLMTVIFIEAIWIWHSVFLLSTPPSILLVGSSFILMSLVVFPLTKNQSWMDFEFVWDVISIITAITLGAFLSGWELSLFLLPPNPLLTLGWGLSLFSILSGSMLRYNEASQGEPASDRISHLAWIPALPGWALLGYSFSILAGLDSFITLGLTSLSFSLAGIVYTIAHPQKTEGLVLTANLLLSLSIAYIVWLAIPWMLPVERLILASATWTVFELPTLGSYILVGFLKMYTIAKANAANIALIFPVVVGVWFGSTFLFQASCPLLLGLDVRPFFQALSVAAVSIGAMYFLEALFLNDNISQQVRAPSIALLGRGILILLLSLYLPEAFLMGDLSKLSYLILGSVTVSLISTSGLNLLFNLRKAAERTWMFAGFSLLPAAYLGLVIYRSFDTVTALTYALILTFFMEVPFLKSQILAAYHLMSRFARAVADVIRNLGATISRVLRNIGAKLSRALRRFAIAVRVFFEQFGYFNWVAFSLIFTIGLSYFSEFFFSEFLGMNPLSFLYWIPRVSIPVLILGLLLLTVAIVRRTVKSTFGAACSIIAMSGAALTGTAWLFDHGFLILSIAVGMILIGFGGLTALFERKVEGNLVSIFWLPIPVSISLVIIHFLGTSLLAFSVAFMIGILLIQLSAFTRMLPDSLTNHLWFITAISTGAASFMIASLGLTAFLSLYIAIFVGSLILWPVTYRISKHLFVAPIFFALTGYAFTSVTAAYSEFIHGLLLALAPFLLFLVLFIKEKEDEKPRLAYLRLVLLLILLGALGAFGISMFTLFM